MITILVLIVIAWAALLALVVGMLHVATSRTTPLPASNTRRPSIEHGTSTTSDDTTPLHTLRFPATPPTQAA